MNRRPITALRKTETVESRRISYRVKVGANTYILVARTPYRLTASLLWRLQILGRLAMLEFAFTGTAGTGGRWFRTGIPAHHTPAPELLNWGRAVERRHGIDLIMD